MLSVAVKDIITEKMSGITQNSANAPRMRWHNASARGLIAMGERDLFLRYEAVLGLSGKENAVFPVSVLIPDSGRAVVVSATAK